MILWVRCRALHYYMEYKVRRKMMSCVRCRVLYFFLCSSSCYLRRRRRRRISVLIFGSEAREVLRYRGRGGLRRVFRPEREGSALFCFGVCSDVSRDPGGLARMLLEFRLVH